MSAELEAAYERVKTKVQEIAEECRARNVRFRYAGDQYLPTKYDP